PAAALRKLGAEVIELDVAEILRCFHTSEAFDLYLSLVGADGGAGARRIARGCQLDWRVARLIWVAGLGPGRRSAVLAALRLSGQRYLARLVKNARPRSANRYWQLIERKNALVTAVMEEFSRRRIDAILCPPHALPAPPH